MVKAKKMNSLDKIMKSERKRRYKRLRKLFKARDMASKYLKRKITISALDKYFSFDEHDYYFTGNLAKRIIDENKRILGIRIRPPRPPIQRK